MYVWESLNLKFIFSVGKEDDSTDTAMKRTGKDGRK